MIALIVYIIVTQLFSLGAIYGVYKNSGKETFIKLRVAAVLHFVLAPIVTPIYLGYTIYTKL